MYVRDAKNRDEVWLLDRIEEMGLDDTAFRSRDYVIAVDEGSDERAGFGRIRVHKADERERTQSGRTDRAPADVCEMTSIGVLDGWREQGVGAHVVERLVEYASDEEFEVVYALTDEASYLAQFGFESMPAEELPEALGERLAEKRDGVAPDATPMRLDVDAFSVPESFRERFKTANKDEEPPDADESAEDFGIDEETATYKYDTGR
ncbi:GNAT family N-acetyltransferase [Halorubellus sp. JP-L1]|uniref:GNAT family N-acetyltransferase n=1 Tax=Halorubellus sp. JP-L1 TaxID=2715753 RepID=UPI001407C33D|nr:GNAT family N-acetyltransferase [Halorubellus sp. JP-L1]NHN42548.1 GNAT family N-acetyltransferase [Halorubellus sp. JP-L1]